MNLPARLETYSIGDLVIQVVVPDPREVQKAFASGRLISPYWTQVWPAARALAQFLAARPELVRGRRVLEIAAGLGLPSLVAARLGASVHCTEGEPSAIEWIEASARVNDLSNLEASVWNWDGELPPPACDLLLLSDVNYDRSAFDRLNALLAAMLEKGITILLATPQRLLARPFVEGVVQFAQHQETSWIGHGGKQVAITLLVMGPTAGSDGFAGSLA